MHKFILPLIFVVVGLPVLKADITIEQRAGTPYEADGFTGFTTQMADMVGLNVEVTFSDGSTDLQTWTATGIVGNGWTMTHGPGSSFSNPFTFQNSSGLNAVNLRLHGGGTTTLFDRATSPSTDGSANGRDLFEQTTLSQSQDILVTYFDSIQLAGSTPVGDIFAGLNIAFETGVASGQTFSFVTDTDTSTNLLRAIPEPATSWMVFVALVVSYSKRRKKKHAW